MAATNVYKNDGRTIHQQQLTDISNSSNVYGKAVYGDGIYTFGPGKYGTSFYGSCTYWVKEITLPSAEYCISTYGNCAYK